MGCYITAYNSECLATPACSLCINLLPVVDNFENSRNVGCNSHPAHLLNDSRKAKDAPEEKKKIPLIY